MCHHGRPTGAREAGFRLACPMPLQLGRVTGEVVCSLSLNECSSVRVRRKGSPLSEGLSFSSSPCGRASGSLEEFVNNTNPQVPPTY